MSARDRLRLLASELGIELFRPFAVRFDAVDRAVHALAQVVASHLTRVDQALRPPFVCVWAIGLDASGRVTALGATGRAAGQVELASYVPLKHVRVMVFADLERVRDIAIFLGPDMLASAIGSCPVGYADEWPLGVKLRVVTREAP